MLQKNASKAFDNTVIENMFYNMLYESYHTNGIYYADATHIFNDDDVSMLIHKFANRVMQFNADILDDIDVTTCNNQNSREMYDTIYELADVLEAVTFNFLHEHTNAYMRKKSCDTSFVYQLAYGCTETMLSIMAVSRTLTFRTQ